MIGIKTFDQLLRDVEEVHKLTSLTAKGAINQLLTARNWAIGYNVVEFEQNGQNRANYGSNLLSNLAEKLNIKGLDRQMLTSCRTFYIKYPQICGTVSRILQAGSKSSFLPKAIPLTLPEPDKNGTGIEPTEICDSVSRKFEMNPELLITKDRFRIEYASQLNAYVSYYKFEEMTDGDNPPVGILLCAEKGPKMVQYVLNGMDENLFVSKYMLQLPDKVQLEAFLIKEIKELGL